MPTTDSPAGLPTFPPYVNPTTDSPIGMPRTDSPAGSPTFPPYSMPTTDSPAGSPTFPPYVNPTTYSPIGMPTTDSPAGSHTFPPYGTPATDSPNGTPTSESDSPVATPPSGFPTKAPTFPPETPTIYSSSPVPVPPTTSKPTVSTCHPLFTDPCIFILQRSQTPLSKCCPDKKVKITKVFIKGEPEINSGEYQLRLNTAHYWPNTSTDCSPYDDFFGEIWCEWANNQFHSVPTGSQICLKKHVSLDVGIVEHDIWPEINDSSSAVLLNQEWYVDTCAPYEVTISAQFKAAVKNSVCWSLEAKAAHKKKYGVESAVQACSEWESPAASFVWYLEVAPACCP